MSYSFLRNFILLSLAVVSCGPAMAATWTQPTPEELKMTSDPKAPGAPAVFLEWDEDVNIPEHFHRVYARVKILTEKGRQEFGEYEIPYEGGQQAIRAVEGRTIHSDGTVIPFTGTPHDKELARSGGSSVLAKVFAMPDVQVGSIVEYRYELQYDDRWVFPAQFALQRRLYVHHGHFLFVPQDISLESTEAVVVTDAQGKPHYANRILYDAALPPGAKLLQVPRGYDLTVSDVAPIADEPYSPPLNSFSYRLNFYYSADWTGQEYWNSAGRGWARDFDHFAEPSDGVKQAVAQIVSPGDSDAQKLAKIYAAVMTVENTQFSRERSQGENQGSPAKTAADVWARKVGSPNDITRLFVAMARAAGLKAYGMIVTERDKRVLNANFLQWNQLSDEIAVVMVDGKETYFDPGQRYCEYGKLHWMHTQVLGIRETDSGTSPQLTPAADYKDSQVQRVAQLQLAGDGKVQGVVKITMTGVEALRWRQIALRSDEAEAGRRIEGEIQGRVPAGVQVKVNSVAGLTDPTQPVVAMLTVSGSMGTQTGNRIILPSEFFESTSSSPFVAETRENPVDLHYPYAEQDMVKVTVAPGLRVASVPQNAQIPYPQNAQYVAKYAQSGTTFQQARLLAVGNTIFKKEEYPQLRDFFEKTSTQDRQQVVLERADTTGATPAGGGKSE